MIPVDTSVECLKTDIWGWAKFCYAAHLF